MTSIISVLSKNHGALLFTQYVLKKFQESTTSDEKQTLSLANIKEIIQQSPELSADIQSANLNIDELTKTVYWQLRLYNLMKENGILDTEDASPLYEQASKKSKEIMSELIPQILPKIILMRQAEWKAHFALIKPIINELLSGDYEGFKKILMALTAGEIPYEDLVRDIYKAINKESNSESKKLIQEKLEILFNHEIEEGKEDEWIENLDELGETIKGLITPKEVKDIVARIQKIPKNELGEVLNLLKEQLLPSLLSPEVLQFAIEFAANDPGLKQLLESAGYKLVPVDSLENGDKTVEVKDVIKTKSPAAKVTQPKPETNPKGWGNGYGKWIVGLGSAVLALGGYVLNENKLKGFIVGLGTLGIGGVLASAFEPIRTLFGVIQKEIKQGKGWADDYGKWIMGLGSGALALIGYYLNDDKLKASILGLGGLGIGGALASTLSPARTLFGIPDEKQAK